MPSQAQKHWTKHWLLWEGWHTNANHYGYGPCYPYKVYRYDLETETTGSLTLGKKQDSILLCFHSFLLTTEAFFAFCEELGLLPH